MKFKIDKSNWTPVTFGQIVSEVKVRVADPSQGEYERFVGLEHFDSGSLTIRSWKPTDNLTSSGKHFLAGDILFARRNAYLRRASLVNFEGVCSGDAFVLREKHDVIVPGFAAFVVNSDALWDYANTNAAGTMSKRVKFRDLANYPFLLPPKAEQERLAELLWAGDAMVEGLEEVAFQQDRLQYIHTEKFFLRNKFLLKKLSCVADVRYGLTVNAARRKLPSKSPYLRVANVSRNSLNLDEVKLIGATKSDIDTYALQLDDILVVEGHANKNEIGRSALWRNELGTTLHQNHLIRIRCGIEIQPFIINAFINSQFGRSYFSRNSKSTSGLNTINSTTVKEFKVPIIDSRTYNIFLEKSNRIAHNSATISDSLTNTKSLQKSLINQIF